MATKSTGSRHNVPQKGNNKLIWVQRHVDFDLKTLEILNPQCVKHTGEDAKETKTQHGRRLWLLFSSQSALQLNEAIYSGGFSLGELCKFQITDSLYRAEK